MRKREEPKQVEVEQAETLAAAPRVERLTKQELERYAEIYPGESVSITIGAEMYSPVKYHNFEIGPFSATVIVRPGETGADAVQRCYRILLELNEAEFQIAWNRHRERCAKTGGGR